ncbi:50S ribosomal protein L27 [Candida maltosa Xu316]|uniref:Large ribosomal subunit protein bL27m n=1 Tax=Candida maltosa (strain Xu316) TaxID=1245528 RepID=M3JXF9_CANMX|nr:50S ribosomal protein L27 [Candida maltosa Xu316]
MSLVKGLFSSTRKSIDLSSNPSHMAMQIRTAKKRVSGSKTNNKDSKGRRLGPKKHEGHFIKTSEIIMRQRGTRIHPGENVGIGLDHTLFALEPGYVRFYYDPFHPTRKYVGVALKKDIRLPKPHFEPRLRRFGYVPIDNPAKAEIEEATQSRKEILAQDELNKIKESKLKKQTELVNSYKEQLNSVYNLNLEESDLENASQRLYNIYQLCSVGQSLKDARTQVTFNRYYDLSLQVRRGEISQEECKELQKAVKEFAEKIDNAVGVEFAGILFKNLTEQEHTELKTSLKEKLATLYKENALQKDYRKQAREIIDTPGAFGVEERTHLANQYVPDVLPLDVPGSVIEIEDPKKPPKGLVVQKIFDQEARKLKIVGRPKEVFASV